MQCIAIDAAPKAPDRWTAGLITSSSMHSVIRHPSTKFDDIHQPHHPITTLSREAISMTSRQTRRQDAVFKYQALGSPDTFRLLWVQNSQNNEIHCSLRHYILGSPDCPGYRAVSYTWGQDEALHSVYMSDGQTFKVRKNLRDLLRHVRDRDAGSSGCLLWIDAICIDQRANNERNHQVRLMASIYGNANSVLVWLQSASEDVDVAKAFSFIEAATAHDETNHSIYNYCKSHPSKAVRSWRSVQKLCGLRYWTRKWIIQELVLAKTVVLQAGAAKCTMDNFERFCSQLQQNSKNPAFQKLVALESHVIKSSAVTLAVQRFGERAEPRSGFLYELVERYAANQCQEPCDHVYALHSLVGDHRAHLGIDYSATPVQRLVAVLRFVRDYETLPPSETLSFVNLLIRLFGITQDDEQHDRDLLDRLDLRLPVTSLGAVELEGESSASTAVRQMVEPLDPMPTFMFDTSQDTWTLAWHRYPDDPNERVGRPDLSHFSIFNGMYHGLAACRLADSDAIWYVPGTQLVFVVRDYGTQRALVLGRAYLFLPDLREAWLRRPLDDNAIRAGMRYTSMSLSTLMVISSLAMPLTGESKVGFKNVERDATSERRTCECVGRETTFHSTDYWVG